MANWDYLELFRNLEYYEVWLGLADGAETIDFYGEFADRTIVLKEIINTRQTLLDATNHPVVQGTFGILTLSFLATIGLSALTLLIYSLLSVEERTLQFGLFRAMGMPTGDVRSILIIENIITVGASLVVGAIAGEASAGMFIPFLELLFGGGTQTPPFRIVASAGDYFRLYVAIGLGVVLALIVLSRLIGRIRTYEAIKLGED